MCRGFRFQHALTILFAGRDEHSYMFALAACARASLDAQPNTPAHDEYRRLIADYETLVPHVIPKGLSYVLWHPDLHAGNIIVTETTERELEGIIDWQGALVAPSYVQVACPPAYIAKGHPLIEYSDDGSPELAPDVAALNDEQRRLAEHACRHAWRQSIYQYLLWDFDHKLAFLSCTHGAAASLAMAITRGALEGLGFIRQSFLQARAVWDAHPDSNGLPQRPFPLNV